MINKKSLRIFGYCFLIGYVASLVLIHSSGIILSGCLDCNVVPKIFWILGIALLFDIPISATLYISYHYILVHNKNKQSR